MVHRKSHSHSLHSAPDHNARRVYPLRILHSAMATLLLVLPVSAQSPADARFALVIGNSAYKHIDALSNPDNDARAVAGALSSLGFSVMEIRDADSTTMRTALTLFEQQIKKRNAAAVVYYAGHGVQMDWKNYLLPVNANVRNADEVRQQSLDVNDITQGLNASGTRISVIILDACRNNPFNTSSRSKGLAPLDAPVGTYFAYATAPGNIASDGEESLGNGLFTHYLLKELKRPAVIEEMFRRVRLGVRKHSNGQQIPWDSSSLEESFAINDGRTQKDFKPAAPPPAPLASASSFEQQKAEWDKVRQAVSAAEVYDYLDKFPVGHITQQALFKLDQLAPAAIEPQRRPELPAQKSGQARFKVGDTWTELTYDSYNNVQISRVDYRVESVNGNIATIRSDLGTDRRTLDGGLLSVRTGEGQFQFDPARIFMPGDEILAGKKWYSTTVQDSPFGRHSRTENFKVVGVEKIKIKAGEFTTWKIVSEGFANGIRSEFQYWVLPDFGVPLKWTRIVHRNRGTAREHYELAELKRAE